MTRKTRRLSHELLVLALKCFGISFMLFLILSGIAGRTAESYIFQHDIPMTEFDWMVADRWIFGISALLAFGSFTSLFLVLLGDRITYIRKITAGIDALHNPEKSVSIPLEGNNELTALAAAVNELSEVRQQLRQKEQALAQEKDQLVRSLSHDIRTPLTSILAWSELLADRAEGEQKAQLNLICSKAEQIRDLTAVLLDGTRRHTEHFDDGKLLMEQLVAEFEEELEDRFSVLIDFDRCSAFSAQLDVQELRRIFDNLASNIGKYADPAHPVGLAVAYENGTLSIRQRNTVLPQKEPGESYGIGLNSIRRIAQGYGGNVDVENDQQQFCICIIFRNL